MRPGIHKIVFSWVDRPKKKAPESVTVEVSEHGGFMTADPKVHALGYESRTPKELDILVRDEIEEAMGNDWENGTIDITEEDPRGTIHTGRLKWKVVMAKKSNPGGRKPPSPGSLPPKGKRQLAAVYESAKSSLRKKGVKGKKLKARAAQQAWCAVERGYKKVGGKWVRRKRRLSRDESSPGCSPRHANAKDFEVRIMDLDQADPSESAEVWRGSVHAFLRDNKDGLSTKEQREVLDLKPGDYLHFGGGASPLMMVARMKNGRVLTRDSNGRRTTMAKKSKPKIGVALAHMRKMVRENLAAGKPAPDVTTLAVESGKVAGYPSSAINSSAGEGLWANAHMVLRDLKEGRFRNKNGRTVSHRKPRSIGRSHVRRLANSLKR